jgi:hypothetical protein
MTDDNDTDKDFASITGMAKRLGLAGEEATKYVHDHMTKLGYKSRRTYFRDKESGGGGGWWKGSGDSGDNDGGL